MKNEIIVINDKKMTLAEIFVPNGVDKIIAEIKEKANNFVPDMTTKQGREEIASFAYKIAKTKTILDKAGKSLTDKWREKTNLVNIERKKAREELDILKEKIRKPLTEWENKEKIRIEECNKRIKELEDYKNLRDLSPTEFDECVQKVEFYKTYKWEEFKVKAENLIEEAIEYLQTERDKALKQEKERLELEKLRKKDEERKIKDREEQIKKETKEKAEREAKEKALKEKKRVEEEKKQAKIKAKEKQDKIKREKEEIEIKLKEQNRLRIETEKKAKEDVANAKLESDNREKEQERLRKEAEIQAKNNIEQAKIQAEKDKQEAIKKERERVKIEKKKEQEELAKREADLNHRRKINNEIMDDLAKIKNIDAVQYLKAIITAIANNKVRNLSIKY